MLRLIPLALVGVVFAACPARAHYNMLLPQPPAVKRGEAVTVVYQWGHPFEHQLFDAPLPQDVAVHAPNGEKIDLIKALAKNHATQQPMTYSLRFTPDQRGDYLFILNTPPIWMEEDQEFLQDTVKTVLHVQAQNGWDRVAGQPFEMTPLTRPYGLQPGLVFQAQVLAGNKPLSGGIVEVEHYNPAVPKELPADEQITRAAKTDPNGVVTCTLAEPGWWCLTAQRDGGKLEHNGKTYPVRQRTTLWVWVDEKPAANKHE